MKIEKKYFDTRHTIVRGQEEEYNTRGYASVATVSLKKSARDYFTFVLLVSIGSGNRK